MTCHVTGFRVPFYIEWRNNKSMLDVDTIHFSAYLRIQSWVSTHIHNVTVDLYPFRDLDTSDDVFSIPRLLDVLITGRTSRFGN